MDNLENKMIQVKARRQGGAVVITIPADLLKLRNIKAGDVLDMDVLPDGFVIRKAEPAYRRFTLSELLEGMDLENIKDLNAQVVPAMAVCHQVRTIDLKAQVATGSAFFVESLGPAISAEIVARTISVIDPAKG
jgi:antitoxin ChpS